MAEDSFGAGASLLSFIVSLVLFCLVSLLSFFSVSPVFFTFCETAVSSESSLPFTFFPARVCALFH